MLDRRLEIMKTLRATPIVLRALVEGIDDARLRRRPAPGEWAIIEVVGHLADTEERALGRVHRMLAEDTPFLEPFDQEALAVQRRDLDLELERELAPLERLRAEHLALLVGLDGSGWERTGRHGQHGDMTVELYETTWRPRRSTTWPRSPGCGSPGAGPPSGLAGRRRARSGVGASGDRLEPGGRSPEQRGLKITPRIPPPREAVAWTRR